MPLLAIAGLPEQAIFIGSALLILLLLLRATSAKKTTAIIALAWLAVQGAVAASGFYLKTDMLPPRIVLALLPPVLFILALFVLPRGRAWMDALDLRALVLLHVVRVPVEFGLHALYLHGTIPELMTWEGRNFDILSGATAPLIALIAFRNERPNKGLLIVWNLFCLGLLANVVFYGVLSVPTPFQRFGFEQPNVGLLHFPYIWLPAFIVPTVLLAHLAAVRRLFRKG